MKLLKFLVLIVAVFRAENVRAEESDGLTNELIVPNEDEVNINFWKFDYYFNEKKGFLIVQLNVFCDIPVDGR